MSCGWDWEGKEERTVITKFHAMKIFSLNEPTFAHDCQSLKGTLAVEARECQIA